MKITLYNNTSDRRCLNKNISILKDFENAKMVEPFSILNPQFIISYDSSLLTNCNYCYCVETNRFYYVNEITILTGGRMQLNCTFDVLMSYKEQIKTLNALCLRNEFKRNQFISDDNYPVTVRTKQRVIEFSENPFNITDITPETTNCFIICVAGNEGVSS